MFWRVNPEAFGALVLLDQLVMDAFNLASGNLLVPGNLLMLFAYDEIPAV